jgi:hypothetical protein
VNREYASGILEEQNMCNVEIDAPLFDGDLVIYHKKGESCQKAIDLLVGREFPAKPRCLNLTVHTRCGKMVDVMIPYDGRSSAKVFVDDEIV